MTDPTEADFLDDQLTKAVRDDMERHFIEDDVGPGCFDSNEHMMQEIISNRLSESTKRHLLNCVRCRYIYATIRRTM